jgi:tetrapyrrole methylase family protein/MazG family protein
VGLPRVVVVGLGPGAPDLVTVETHTAIARVSHRFLRTAVHPSADAVADATTFDHRYESAASLEEVYAGIVDELVAAAVAHGEVLYAVPGSPLIAERTVELLRSDDRVETQILPAVSYMDVAWAALGVDPLAAGARLVDGRRFATDAAGERGPLLVGQCDRIEVLSDIKLAVDEAPERSVVVLQRLGLPDAAVFEVAWDELDRAVHPDHLTSLWIPELVTPVGGELVRFHELVRLLRERCPWDREQTHASLVSSVVEEAYELVEAIDQLSDGDDGDEHLAEELGDLLFQVEFHAVIAEQEGRFTMADVARGICDKLVHRHPHVFGSVEAETSDHVLENWEAIKRAEKGRTSVFDGVPAALPALTQAAKVQRRAASVGFDWPDAQGALPKIAEEAHELLDAADDPQRSAEELGDLLFAVVNVARHLRVDPEDALRAATTKFRSRFEAVERLAASRGLTLETLDLAGLDALWDEVKNNSFS